MSSAAKENSDQKGNALSDDGDEAVFDRAAIKRRAFAEPPAPHTPGEKGEKKISYAVDGIDAKKVDGSYQFNFQGNKNLHVFSHILVVFFGQP